MESKIIVVLLISLVLLSLTIKNFIWGLYIFIFLCPIIPPVIALYINASLPLITFQRIMLVVLVVVWSIKYLMGQMPQIEKPPLIELLFVFVGFVFFSCIFASQSKIAFKEFFSERIIGVPIIYFLFFQFMRDEKAMKKTFYVLMISGFVVAVIGIIQALTQTSPFYYLGKYFMPEEKILELGFADIVSVANRRLGLYRVQSTIPSIGLSAYLAFIIPVFLMITNCIKQKTYRFVMILGVIILIVCEFFTLSLGGWLTTYIAVILLLESKKIKLFLLIIGLTLLLTICYFIGMLNKERGGFRAWQFLGAIQITLEYPLFGTGLNTFNDIVKVPIIPGENQPRYADAVSYPQKLLVETGIPSVSILAVFLLLILIKVRQSCQRFHYKKVFFYNAVSKGLLAGIVGNLVLSVASVSLLNSHTGIIVFWVSLAIAMRLWVISIALDKQILR